MKPKGSRLDGVSRLFSGLRGKAQTEDFPLLPLRELVLFPQTVIPMFITYKAGISAVDTALSRDMRLFAACLKSKPEAAGVNGASGAVSVSGFTGGSSRPNGGAAAKKVPGTVSPDSPAADRGTRTGQG